MGKPLYNPRIWQSVLMLFVYQFIFYLIPLTLLMVVLQSKGYSPSDLLIQLIVSIVGFTLLLSWLGRRSRLGLKSLFPTSRFRVRYLAPIFFTVLGLDIVISEIGNWMQIYLPMNRTVGDSLMGLFSVEAGLGKSFLLVVIFAPLLEEIVFRGLILRGFLHHYSVKKAVLVSSLLFGLFHMNIWQFPGGLAWGIIAAWWFVETRSLLYCTLGHAIMNGLGFFTVVLKNKYDFIIPGFSSDYQQAMFHPLWFTIIGLTLLIFGVLTLNQMFIKDRLRSR